MVAHVRRLLDIVSCTNSFGPSLKQEKSKTPQTTTPKIYENGMSLSTTSDGTPEDGEETGRNLARKGPSSEKRVLSQVDENVVPGRVDREKSIVTGKPEAMAAMAAAKEATEKGDMSGMCPPSKLGQFYEFFSFSHVTPPIQCKRVWTFFK